MKTTIKIWFSFFVLSTIFVGCSWAASSATFLSSIATQKDSVLSWYDAAYTRVYKKFGTSGASLMKSLNYQSLVCLGVMNNGSFLQQMQDELKSMKVDFLNQYNTIVASVWDLDQKQHIYTDSNVSLFTYGSYDKDLAALSTKYAQLISGSQQNIVTFQTKYDQALSSFVSQFATYVKKNQTLIDQVSSKLTLVQSLDTRFASLDSVLSAYRLRLAGTWSSFFSNLPTVKTKTFAAFDTALQSVADIQINKQRILKNLSGALLPQKLVALSGYADQFDSTYNQFLSSWYDNAGYLALQTKIDAFHIKYLSGSTYSCSSILSTSWFDLDVASIIKDINQFSGSLSSWSDSVSSGAFQKRVLSWFSTLQDKQKTLLASYTTFVQTTTQTLLAQYKQNAQTTTSWSSSVSTGTLSPAVVVPPVISSFVAPVWFSFTQAFTTNQKHASIGILQKLLTSISYYSGAINNTYTKETKSAVYRFQLDHGLLKWYEKRPQTRWWMGPATRATLNNLLH